MARIAGWTLGWVLGMALPWVPLRHEALRLGVLSGCLGVAILGLAALDLGRVSQGRALRELAHRLEQASVLDGLTRVYNRAYLERTLAVEISFALRHQSDLAVIVLDIDHFRQINEQHGHDAGDDVIAEVAQVLTRSVRTEDVVARFGGEEFVILLRSTSVESASIVAERVRSVVEATPCACGPGRARITLSAGCTSLQRTQGRRAKDLLEAADECLQAAKERGRNRVVCTPAPAFERTAVA